jgi:hypothetical protein
LKDIYKEVSIFGHVHKHQAQFNHPKVFIFLFFVEDQVHCQSNLNVDPIIHLYLILQHYHLLLVYYHLKISYQPNFQQYQNFLNGELIQKQTEEKDEHLKN